LKQIATINLPFFGELGSTGPFPKTETWLSYVQAKLSFHLNEALALEIFDHEVLRQFWNTFNTYVSALSGVNIAHLVHVDYHFGNLLFVGDQITGVVDFEWAFAGDPLYDLCRWKQDKEEWPGSRKAFLKGYQQSDFSGVEFKRIKIYQMIRNVELCIVAKRHFTPDEAKSYREITIAQMKTLLPI
jgi:thiamine kinase-like enzyme